MQISHSFKVYLLYHCGVIKRGYGAINFIYFACFLPLFLIEFSEIVLIKLITVALKFASRI